MKVVALDPGGYTGIATFDATEMPNGELYDMEFQQFWLGPDEHHDKLELFLDMQHTHGMRVVFESFEFRQQQRAGLVLVSLEYIGVIKAWCLRNGVEWTAQTAAQGKGFSKDEHLNKLGILLQPVSAKPNKDMNDASRHLLYYLINKDKRAARYLLEKAWK